MLFLNISKWACKILLRGFFLWSPRFRQKTGIFGPKTLIGVFFGPFYGERGGYPQIPFRFFCKMISWLGLGWGRGVPINKKKLVSSIWRTVSIASLGGYSGLAPQQMKNIFFGYSFLFLYIIKLVSIVSLEGYSGLAPWAGEGRQLGKWPVAPAVPDTIILSFDIFT